MRTRSMSSWVRGATRFDDIGACPGALALTDVDGNLFCVAKT